MTDWKKVLEANGQGVKVHEGNRVDYLIDGWATYAAMCEAIRTTFKKEPSYYIYLLAWWLDDQFPLIQNDGESTIEKLFRKASVEFGVQIRVMLWENYLAGAPGLLTDYAKLLLGKKPEIVTQQQNQVTQYNNLPTGGAILDALLPSRFQSHHEKLMIVKGERGLVGSGTSFSIHCRSRCRSCKSEDAPHSPTPPRPTVGSQKLPRLGVEIR